VHTSIGLLRKHAATLVANCGYRSSVCCANTLPPPENSLTLAMFGPNIGCLLHARQAALAW
ncbi:MAG: hypothetical protein KAT00_11700, partial [Planctomycetes bacterium]|nr:hypothetical protein [Planctomycetota bacterium]